MTRYDIETLRSWMDRCETQALEIRVLEGELLRMRTLAFEIWCRDFERLKQRIQSDQLEKGAGESK